MWNKQHNKKREAINGSGVLENATLNKIWSSNAEYEKGVDLI